MEQFERARLDSYFTRVADIFAPAEKPSAFLITHLLPERPAFVRAVGISTNLRAVLPKPKSVDLTARREIEKTTQCDALSRDLFEDPDSAVDYVESRAGGEAVVLLDVGGYFAPTVDALCERFSGRVLGVIEDTENGHKRYAHAEKLPCPVVSVARSPLKDPEDFLVGQSVVFSTEALMRSRGDILHGRTALVIGFGKLGSSIARLLHAKGVQVTVYDLDPVRRTQALSQASPSPGTATPLYTGPVSSCARPVPYRCGAKTSRPCGTAPTSLRSPAAKTNSTWPASPMCTSGPRTGSTSPATRRLGTTSTCSTVATPSTSCTAPASARSSTSCRPRYSRESETSPVATSGPVCTRSTPQTARPSPERG